MGEVQARTVLWYSVFVGFAINYMIRINLNITIVEMVMSKAVKLERANADRGGSNAVSMVDNFVTTAASLVIESNDSISSQSRRSLIQLADQRPSLPSLLGISSDMRSVDSTHRGTNGNVWTTNSTDVGQDQVQLSREVLDGDGVKFSIEKWLLNRFNIHYDEAGFEWNEYQQGLVLGAFFWAHWLTQIPGGILAEKYGTKLVFGLSNAAGCWMCFFIPILSYFDYRALIWWRVLQGLICGLSWPAMHVLTAQWIPPNERGKFVTAYLGSSVGIAVFYPLFGYIISWTSWEWVYHICGILGTFWWLGWLIFVFDTPTKHPRISEHEVRYIEKSLGASIRPAKQRPRPWKAILTSRPVWMNVIAQWGGIWGLFTLMTQAPTYFKTIHHWNITATGILSGLPHLMRMLFAYVFSIFGDYLLRTEKMSRTNVRKLATTFCCIVKGIMVLGLAYYVHDSTAAIVFLTLATMFHGAVSSGPLASIVDIAPNHAGTVLGISGMIGVLPGFISPVIVGILTLGNQSYQSWKYVFLISAGMLIGSGVLYDLFASSELQPWNSYNPAKDDKELQLLSTEKDTNQNQPESEQRSMVSNNTDSRKE